MIHKKIKFEINKVKKRKLNIVNIEDTKIGIYCIEDKFYIYKMICPHLGGDLCEGKIDYKKSTIQCGIHGYIFSIKDGELVKNPNVENMILGRFPNKYFDPNIKDRYRLTRLNYKIENQFIIIEY